MFHDHGFVRLKKKGISHKATQVKESDAQVALTGVKNAVVAMRRRKGERTGRRRSGMEEGGDECLHSTDRLGTLDDMNSRRPVQTDSEWQPTKKREDELWWGKRKGGGTSGRHGPLP